MIASESVFASGVDHCRVVLEEDHLAPELCSSRRAAAPWLCSRHPAKRSSLLLIVSDRDRSLELQLISGRIED